MDNFMATQDNRMHPPFYLKYKVKDGYAFDGPFVTKGDCESSAARNEWSAHGIEWEIVGLEEKNSYIPPEPVVEPKKGPGRPRKDTIELE